MAHKETSTNTSDNKQDRSTKSSLSSYDNFAMEEGGTTAILYGNSSSWKNRNDDMVKKSISGRPLIIVLVFALIVVLATATTMIALFATNKLPVRDSVKDQDDLKFEPEPKPRPEPVAEDDLIFEDTFDTFRFDWWQHEMTAGGGGNWEFQYYTNNRSNSYVRDNILYIKPTLTLDKFGNDEHGILYGTLDLWGHTPANLCTAILEVILYYIILFTAIWMLPKYNEYGDWPASGEIDIVESRGNVDYKSPDGVSQGVDSMGSTMHWGPYFPWNGWNKTHATKFFVDDKLTLEVDPGEDGFYKYGGWHESIPDVMNPWANSPNKMAPFDKEFYLVMNVAVGGVSGYFWDGNVNGAYAKPWLDTSHTAAKDFWNGKDHWYPTWNPELDNGESAAMQIKSVRVWKRE
uniref:Beta-1,3-glucan-binding protein-like n=1 Tax=Saccoglossus kowalevskii TaxID=10224 RepID=A0ABM0LU57_SACKO|nr:PREDICTED: beta-1,3-glucan-binding protein-like [Saccoglossus kowalevskii]